MRTTENMIQPIPLPFQLPGLHSGDDEKIILMPSESALNLVEEKAKLHTNYQRRHRQEYVAPNLRGKESSPMSMTPCQDANMYKHLQDSSD